MDPVNSIMVSQMLKAEDNSLAEEADAVHIHIAKKSLC